MSAALEGAGYEVSRASGALEGLNKIYQTLPDMIIMDSEFGIVDGEDTYTHIRQASFLPMIVLGNHEEVGDVLELGADAFMTKPPNLIELVARVGRLLKQKHIYSTKENNQKYNEDRLFTETNGFATLCAIEFRLALCLILSKGKIVEYSELISEVWDGQKVDRSTLNYYIQNLSKKLQVFFPERINIMEYEGIGYRLEEV